MYEPLAPCARCLRHVRTSEAGCPFCGGEIGLARVLVAEGRIARAGLAAMAFAVAGCTEPTKEPVRPDPVMKPAVDAGVAAPEALPSQPPPPETAPAPAYGLPPPPMPTPSASTK